MIWDITPRLSPQTDTWPGDTPMSARRVMDMKTGHSVNVTTINTTVQIGAHIDAPLHFASDGVDAAGIDLEPCIGPALVARIPSDGAIRKQDLEPLPLDDTERLLLHTRRDVGAAIFSDGVAFLEPEAAVFLAGKGLRLLGIDSFSVDHPDSKTLDSHHALSNGGCTILEGIDLSGVPPGRYELIALPLPLVGCDASPVRAILRDMH